MNKPRVNSEGQRELQKIEEKFDNFQKEIKDFNPIDGKAPDAVEPQTKVSNREANKADAIWVEPVRSIRRAHGGKDGAKVYWDEANRSKRDYDWEYVRCIVENREIIGEAVEVWSGKWGCDPIHFWKVPVNKPIMIPRHLAKQLSECKYHRLRMEDRPVEQTTMGTITGAMIADQVISRIDCRPVGFGF